MAANKKKGKKNKKGKAEGGKAATRAGMSSVLASLDAQTRLDCVLEMVSSLLGSIGTEALICMKRPDKDDEYWIKDTATGRWIAPCQGRLDLIAALAGGTVTCVDRSARDGSHWYFDTTTETWLEPCPYSPPWCGGRKDRDVICVSRPDKGGAHWLWDTAGQRWVSPCPPPRRRRRRG